MDIKNLFKSSTDIIKGPIALEWIMLMYCGLTLLLALFLYDSIEVTPILNRVYILIATIALVGLYNWKPCKATYLLRVIFQIALLSYWYPDIYYYARLMPNTDHLFASLDQIVFGFQPAIVFSQVLNGFWWKELFNLGYFSYYLMIISVVILPLVKGGEKLDYSTCVMVCSFMLYYLIFIFLLSSGPQFYFQYIGFEKAQAGIFPEVGDWFRYHDELIHDHTTEKGLFSYLVEMMQGSEKPIAAFPSSHVGLSTIILILIRNLSHRAFKVMFPFYCILCVSTVYIGAHYAIDVIGGWISAIPIYFLSDTITRKFFKVAL